MKSTLEFIITHVIYSTNWIGPFHDIRHFMSNISSINLISMLIRIIQTLIFFMVTCTFKYLLLNGSRYGTLRNPGVSNY